MLLVYLKLTKQKKRLNISILVLLLWAKNNNPLIYYILFNLLIYQALLLSLSNIKVFVFQMF